MEEGELLREEGVQGNSSQRGGGGGTAEGRGAG